MSIDVQSVKDTMNEMGLLNTLDGMDVKTLTEALRKQFEEEMAARTAAAQQAASQAGAQYQQAAQTPAPEPSIMEQVIPSAFANLASVVSQDPTYRQQASARIQQRRQQLMQERADNLAALRDVFREKADVAQRLGDREAEEKARLRHEQLSKTLESMLQGQRYEQEKDLLGQRQEFEAGQAKLDRQSRLNQIVQQGIEQRKLQEMKPSITGPERASLIKQGIDPATGLMNPAWAQVEIRKNLALAKKAQKKEDQNLAVDSMLRIAVMRTTADKDPQAMVKRVLNIKDPFAGEKEGQAKYALTGEKIHVKRKGKWVVDPEAAKRAVAKAKELVDPWFQE